MELWEKKYLNSIYSMIKSYQEWGTDRRYFENLRVLLEFNLRTLWQNFRGQGMGQEDKAGYERLGSMIGYAPSGWNIAAKDSSQRGLEFMNTIQNNPNEAMKMVKQGSPLQLAYRMIEELKQKFGRGPMDSKDLMVLVRVLMNAHSGGTIDFGELRSLWNMVVDIEKNPPDAKTDQNKEMAVQDNLITPLHLLMRTFSIGNGIFSAPSNIGALRKDCSEIIKKYYPKLYRQMYRNTYGTNPVDSSKPKPPTPSPIDPADIDNLDTALEELNKALATGDPKIIDPVVKRLQPILQKVKTALPKPATP